jgi:TRAP transporter TAXI family solute receptor
MSRLRFSFGMLAVLFLVSGCSSPPVEATPQEIRLAVGSRGGDFWNFGSELEKFVQTRHGNYKVTITRAVGRQTLQAVQDGTADCGFAFSNLAYEAYSGKLDVSQAPFDHLRAVASIEVTPLNLLVSAGSPVQRIGDLRGRRVLIGSPDSGSFRAAKLVLEAYGLSEGEGAVETVAEGFNRARPYLLNGQADAVLILARGPFGFTDDGLRPVPIDGDAVADLRRQYPFFRVVLVPSGSFRDHTAPLKTVGIESVLLCRDVLAPELVRQFTGDWFSALDQLLTAGALPEAFTRKTASATPIPLHQGARDYYRARQVLLRD